MLRQRIVFFISFLYMLHIGPINAASIQFFDKGLFNGQMWLLLNESQKITHLTGLREGILLCITEISDDNLIPEKLKKAMIDSGLFDRRRLLFTALGPADLSPHIDTFYKEPLNLHIPIVHAYRYVCMELNHVSKLELEKDLVQMQKRFPILDSGN
ncbi:MAG: hypothetical protein QNI95_10645 [Desulfobacterales bacterium]|nr:hypothetical protein [Desulfobacterales bacterium]